jgi:hypothetical protein
MLTIESKEFLHLVGEAVVLSAQGQFDKAITLLDSKLEHMDQPAKEIALLQLLHSTKEAGYMDKCKNYAQKLDPNIPSVKKVLAAYK